MKVFFSGLDVCDYLGFSSQLNLDVKAIFSIRSYGLHMKFCDFGRKSLDIRNIACHLVEGANKEVGVWV